MSTTPDANRQVILGLWETIDRDRHLGGIDRFIAGSYVRHSSEGDYSRDEFAQAIGDLHAGFPDLSSTTEETIAQGDKVAYRWTSVGTHLATYMSVPATHRQVTATGITISRLEDGLIVEDWASWNKVNVLYELGIIPIRWVH
jgi:steroid delta-isomerase-like uncharacterized protein